MISVLFRFVMFYIYPIPISIPLSIPYLQSIPYPYLAIHACLQGWFYYYSCFISYCCCSALHSYIHTPGVFSAVSSCFVYWHLESGIYLACLWSIHAFALYSFKSTALLPYSILYSVVTSVRLVVDDPYISRRHDAPRASCRTSTSVYFLVTVQGILSCIKFNESCYFVITLLLFCPLTHSIV